jgi:hypothetical protein
MCLFHSWALDAKNKKKLGSLNVKEENGQCISLPIFGMVAIF